MGSATVSMKSNGLSSKPHHRRIERSIKLEVGPQKAILADRSRPAAVRSFVRNWRAAQDETANTYVIEIVLV
jgi:hypothetical protein